MSKVAVRGKGRPELFSYEVKTSTAKEKAVVAVLKKYGIKKGMEVLKTVGVEFQAKVGSKERVKETMKISAPTLIKLCKGHNVKPVRGRPTFKHLEALAALGATSVAAETEVVPAPTLMETPEVEAMVSEGSPASDVQ